MSRRRAFGQLVLTRWRGFYREPEVLFWTFAFPLLLALSLGVAFRDRMPAPARVGVEAGPGGEATAALLAASPDLDPEVMDAAAARAALRAGKLDAVVVPGTPPTYRFDPTRVEGRNARLIVDDTLQRASGRRDSMPSVDQRITEPGSRYIDFLIPGLVGMGLMQAGLWGVGYNLVELRTRKMLKWFVATPMRRGDFLLSFVFMRALFLLVELPVLLGFGVLAFGVPIFGSIALLLSVAVLGSLVFAGLGLLVAARVRTTSGVNGLLNLVTTPMFVASGIFFSPERFPDAAQPLILALPLTALIKALRAIMLDGAGVGGIALEMGILLVWGIVSFVAALKLFRWD